MLERIHKLSEREYRSIIGLSKKDFKNLAALFSECELEIKEQKRKAFYEYHGRQLIEGGKPKLKTPSEKLFFVLFYLKSYPNFDVLGFVFGFKNSTAHDNLHKFLPILEATLQRLKVLPQRKFASVQAFIDFTKGEKDLLIDVTERLHHRKKKMMSNEPITPENEKHIQ